MLTTKKADWSRAASTVRGFSTAVNL